ncbi:MAG: hypothetical protein D6753_13125 [Planctomycetota bacterium]|nr:MAG: hypothetical protein D6753_13125 [Planctomycetota bacterium]
MDANNPTPSRSSRSQPGCNDSRKRRALSPGLPKEIVRNEVGLRVGRSNAGPIRAFRPLACGILLVICSTQPGCILLNAFMEKKPTTNLDTTLLEAQGYSMPPGGMPTTVPASQRSGPSIVLEVRGGDEERHLERIPLPKDRAMFVQDLVQEARLHERIGRLKVSVMRPTGPGQPPVRMEVRTDPQGRVTNVGANYALLPQDHVIVVEDDPPGLSRLIMERLTGK